MPSNHRQYASWLVAALSVLVSLVGNLSDLVVVVAAGVVVGPLAFALALYPVLRGRRWARAAGLVAAMLAVATFAISLALIYGLSHGCGDAPNC